MPGQKDEDKLRWLEARVQQLTEDNDDLRKDTALLRRDNEENSYWVDNQQELIDKCNDLAGVVNKYELENKELKLKVASQKKILKNRNEIPSTQDLNTTQTNIERYIFPNPLPAKDEIKPRQKSDDE